MNLFSLQVPTLSFELSLLEGKLEMSFLQLMMLPNNIFKKFVRTTSTSNV